MFQEVLIKVSICCVTKLRLKERTVAVIASHRNRQNEKLIASLAVAPLLFARCDKENKKLEATKTTTKTPIKFLKVSGPTPSYNASNPPTVTSIMGHPVFSRFNLLLRISNIAV